MVALTRNGSGFDLFVIEITLNLIMPKEGCHLKIFQVFRKYLIWVKIQAIMLCAKTRSSSIF